MSRNKTPASAANTQRPGSIGAITFHNLEICTGPCPPGAPCPTVTGVVEIRDDTGAAVVQWEDQDIDLTLREMRTKQAFEIGPDYCTTYWYDGLVDLVIQHSGGTLTLSQPEDDYWSAVEAAESHMEAWAARAPEHAALEDYRGSLLH